ncbi:MAG: hypothetical protein KBT01_09990 [Clostridiales bacterium]|nr:hypothetical protein [Candidatus Blautia equi]
MKRILSKNRIMLFMICMAMSLFFSVPVFAKAKPACVSKQTIYVAENRPFSVSNYIYIKNASASSKFVKVTSSNKALKATAGRIYGQPVIFVDVPKNVKNGTSSVITIVLKENKVNYTLKCTVKVSAYAPIDSLTVGKQKVSVSRITPHDGQYIYDFLGILRKNTTASVKAGKNQKISVKANKDACITGITYIKGLSTKEIKNGQSVTLAKGSKLCVSYIYCPQNMGTDGFVCGNMFEGYFYIDVI